MTDQRAGGGESETAPTWREFAVHAPQFVQWCVARYGPLPDGPIQQEDYERLRAAHQEAIRG